MAKNIILSDFEWGLALDARWSDGLRIFEYWNFPVQPFLRLSNSSLNRNTPYPTGIDMLRDSKKSESEV